MHSWINLGSFYSPLGDLGVGEYHECSMEVNTIRITIHSSIWFIIHIFSKVLNGKYILSNIFGR